MRSSQNSPADVRMKGFASRQTVEQAWAWLDEQAAPLASESVPLAAAAGRVLSEPIASPIDVPRFARAMMDGYAVRAIDTSGASPYNRLPLNIIGGVLPGETFDRTVQAGEACRVMTGAPLPAGADAVLPFERTECEAERLWALAELSPGKHVGPRGEDIVAGTTLFESGRRLRPQDIGALASIGVAEVAVVRRPRVRLVITGNELLPAGSQPTGPKIVDANGPMLSALVRRDGGEPIYPHIVRDDPSEILEAMRDEADVILVSGGSSVGQEDYAPMLLAEHGELAIHGVAMRPSSPTGMGRLGKRLVFLLPGNPVSCLCAYDFFAGRAIRALGGRPLTWPYRVVRLPLARKLVSTIGRVDYARVRIVGGRVEPLAISGASILSSTTRADGFVIVPADSEGLPPAAEVEVYLYDE